MTPSAYFNLNILLFLLLCPQLSRAQIAPDHPLYAQIMLGDSMIFDRAFNQCETEVLETYIHADFEFYHDQSGITDNKVAFIEGISQGLCQMPYRAQRVLRPQSTKIFLMQNQGEIYGALQMGVHEFYALEENKAPYLTSVARFSHLWIKTGNSWELKRVLSYDHQTPGE